MQNNVNSNQPIIHVEHMSNYFGDNCIHSDVNFTINQGEIFCIVGPSGAGKTTVLRSILRLITPASGQINVLGIDVLKCSTNAMASLQQKWGVLFQHSALFSSLSVLENVMFPLLEFSDLDEKTAQELALLKISMVGLPLSAAGLFPSELSGGMQKRAALARAIALDPDILFLDEPTTGLDPQGAEALDDLILYLRDNLGLTIMIVTHDLDSLWHIADRVCFLADGESIAVVPMNELVDYDHPIIQSYFGGPRGRLRSEKAKK